jgi:hypothetical protein
MRPIGLIAVAAGIVVALIVTFTIGVVAGRAAGPRQV